MKIFVTFSDREGWLCSRMSVVWGESDYMVKTFRQCGWAADFILEGACREDAEGNRMFDVEKVLEGADNPLLPLVIKYLAGS